MRTKPPGKKGRKGHRGRWTRTGPRCEARASYRHTDRDRRESSNPTKILPPAPRRPGQCPHFREARLLTANDTSRSWQRRMRQTGDAHNVTVTCTELAACPESRHSLCLRDSERWLYGQDLISQASDLLLTQEISPGLQMARQRAMAQMFSGYLLPFFWFSHKKYGSWNHDSHVPVTLDDEVLYMPGDLQTFTEGCKCRAH